MFRIGGRIFADEKTEYLITRQGGLAAYSDEGIEAFVHAHQGQREHCLSDKSDELLQWQQETIASISASIDRQRSQAERLVERLFCGRVDKGGKPYIEHLRFVARHAQLLYGSVIGLLHDTLEDTETKAVQLAQYGFDETVITAVELLTHAKGSPYLDYVTTQVARSPYAIDVKLADLCHNMDRSRLSDEQQERMAAKFALYEEAKRYLDGRALWRESVIISE